MKLYLFVFVCAATVFLSACGNSIRVPKTTMDHNNMAMTSKPQNVIPTKSEWTTSGQVVANKDIPISILIKDKSNKPIKKFDVVHEKLMHLIIVSKDLSYFSHIHPDYQSDGEFNITTSFPDGGDYQLIAEFTPHGGGDASVEKHWLHVEGAQVKAEPLAPDTSMTKVVDGLKVTLSFDHLMSEMDLNMTFKISDASTGEPIKDLQPYLGALGHCVAISSDSKDYLHIHPMTTKGSGPKVDFMTYFPEKGIYKIWGQFQYEGRVITVPFVVDVPHMKM